MLLLLLLLLLLLVLLRRAFSITNPMPVGHIHIQQSKWETSLLYLFLCSFGSPQSSYSSSLGSESSSSSAILPSLFSPSAGRLLFCSSASCSSCCAEAGAAALGCRSCSVARLWPWSRRRLGSSRMACLISSVRATSIGN